MLYLKYDFSPNCHTEISECFPENHKSKIEKKKCKISLHWRGGDYFDIFLTFSEFFFWLKSCQRSKKCKGDANGVKKTSSFLILHLNILRETNIFAIVLKIRMKIVFCFVFYFLRSGKSGFEQKKYCSSLFRYFLTITG